jgi:transposase-like protein
MDLKRPEFETVLVKPDILAPRKLGLRADAAGSEFLEYDVAVELELQATGAYEIRKLTLTAVEGGPEVTTEALRGIPLRSIVRLISTSLETWAIGDADAKEIASHGPTDEALTWAARTYALARLTGQSPAKVVAERFGLQPRTATNWIRRARERGLLDTGDSVLQPAGPGDLGRLGIVGDQMVFGEPRVVASSLIDEVPAERAAAMLEAEGHRGVD